MNTWQHLVRRLKDGNTYWGLSVSEENGKFRYRGVQTKLSNGELNISSTQETEDLEQLAVLIPKGSQVFLVYSGNQVITKEVAVINDPNKQVKTAFQSLDLTDFYFEIYTKDGKASVAICRKPVIDELINTLKQKKIFVTDFSLDGLLAESFQEVLHDQQLEVTETYEPAFNGAYTLASKNRKTQTGFSEAGQQLYQTYAQERFYKLGLPAAVGFILVALIINFLFFNSYYGQVEELRQLSSLNESQRENLINLREEVAKKEQLLKDVARSSGSKSSYYLDQIAATLPEALLLDEFNYQPLIKAIKEDQPIELEPNTIIIKGTTRENRELSQWISQLENLDFVKQIAITDLEQLDNKESSFELKLDLKL